jgi:pimeloyl-ACP methyl ester carboxylesterase
MFSEATRPESVDEFGRSPLAFHPTGFRALAYASAEDVHDVLPHINTPTLVVCGDKDVRAPLTVAEDLHEGISGSMLVVLPDTGESSDESNRVVRDFSDAGAGDHGVCAALWWRQRLYSSLLYRR